MRIILLGKRKVTCKWCALLGTSLDIWQIKFHGGIKGSAAKVIQYRIDRAVVIAVPVANYYPAV